MGKETIGWHHPNDEADQWDGFNDSGIEHFQVARSGTWHGKFTRIHSTRRRQNRVPTKRKWSESL